MEEKGSEISQVPPVCQAPEGRVLPSCSHSILRTAFQVRWTMTHFVDEVPAALKGKLVMSSSDNTWTHTCQTNSFHDIKIRWAQTSLGEDTVGKRLMRHTSSGGWTDTILITTKGVLRQGGSWVLAVPGEGWADLKDKQELPGWRKEEREF